MKRRRERRETLVNIFIVKKLFILIWQKMHTSAAYIVRSL